MVIFDMFDLSLYTVGSKRERERDSEGERQRGRESEKVDVRIIWWEILFYHKVF